MALKLAGVTLAKLKGADAAAAELKVDKRTIRRWLAAAPEDGWTLARDLAQARLQEQLATGKVAPSQLATIAGIADRNVRYGELLRRREANRDAALQAEQPTILDRRLGQWQAMLASLEGPQHADTPATEYIRFHVHAVMAKQVEDRTTVGYLALWREALDTQPEQDRASLSWHYLPEEQFADDDRYAAELAQIRADVIAAAEEWWPAYRQAVQARAYARRRSGSGIEFWYDRSRGGGPDAYLLELPTLYAGMPLDVDSVPTEAIDVTPNPCSCPPRPQKPSRTLLWPSCRPASTSTGERKAHV
jgi:hypothetical protein